MFKYRQHITVQGVQSRILVYLVISNRFSSKSDRLEGNNQLLSLP